MHYRCYTLGSCEPGLCPKRSMDRLEHANRSDFHCARAVRRLLKVTKSEKCTSDKKSPTVVTSRVHCAMGKNFSFSSRLRIIYGRTIDNIYIYIIYGRTNFIVRGTATLDNRPLPAQTRSLPSTVLYTACDGKREDSKTAEKVLEYFVSIMHVAIF